MIRARLRAGKRAKASRGGYVGGQVPYGFRCEDRELVPVPEEQQVITLAKTLKARGRSHREIARVLDERYPTRNGGHWHHATVGRILAR